MAKPIDKMTSEELERVIAEREAFLKAARKARSQAKARERRAAEAARRKAEFERVEREKQTLYEWAKKKRLNNGYTVLDWCLRETAKSNEPPAQQVSE